jgi:Mg2+/citrate symporter
VAVSAFVLGFAHEEEFEIIAICAGSNRCLELMTIYALTVVAVITLATLLLVAGYETFQERVERVSKHFSTMSAVVLWVLGAGFLLGVL